MRFIVRLKQRLTNETRRLLLGTGVALLYESKLLPVIGIEVDDMAKITGLGFIKEIREPRQGVLAFDAELLSTVVFQPGTSRKALLSGQCTTGWGGTKIAILDTGVNDDGSIGIVEHHDYTGKGAHDLVPHGTIVAKIIKHFARGALLYSVKIGNPLPDEMNMMRGIEWAIRSGINVINISSGFHRKAKCTGTCDLCKLVNIAVSRGVAVVAAAGNDCQVEDSIHCPGIATSAVTVGAVNQFNQIAEFSSIGKPGGTKPNIVAAGYCFIDGAPFNGTSFAAPIVSGVLGSILFESGNVAKAIEYTYNTATNLGLPFHHQGHGCINIDKLVEEVKHEAANCKHKEQGAN